ncbi:hypothetical protein KP509_17G063200 [Ceratopteris richardii]|uniref:Uncharacterized protein n=1 Tax=Ceratopteris richardii TaxID=49495 RepID=A0A8T2T036_CERRI|nr:hypothetical protein KP509_17G063200 [Ceratopteris richardii]KAH7373572.1 hypothetical protein KP509_17G063200 [Ceratopteris richardii]KAH7373573.1 hypothetical protein KP509_17G063200 [Ceratopteris richardii]KAH7373578.1 hypothetical protein KP509_17G063200 [Ceratopteris richardii]KAH7373580.1 hypothetical protein KP509_17G063200 [Ceratopteris richardii]
MGDEVTEKDGSSEDIQRAPFETRLNLNHKYSKTFLLSFAELESCKKLPAGLEPSLLRENQAKLDERGVAIPGVASRGLIHTLRGNDAHSQSPPDVPEWRRPSSLPGSPFLKPNSRHAELKISSPRPGPARSGITITKSIMGRSSSARYDLRSNGEDKDSDTARSQFEWDLSSLTESSSRFHSRGVARSGLVIPQEHDGLLGSGGPIVHRGMIQTMAYDRQRSNKIGRSGDQYSSTRGGKVFWDSPVLQSPRQGDIDIMSEETFNSDKWTNGERSEQERQRRDQFEQMRKELRKKPLKTSHDYKDTWFGETLHIGEGLLSSSPGTPQSSSSQNDNTKQTNKSMATSSTPRHLVPPGFSKPGQSKTDSPKENHKTGKSDGSDIKDGVMHALDHKHADDSVDSGREEQFNSLLMKLNQHEAEIKVPSPSQSPVMSKFARWFPNQELSGQESALSSEPLNVVIKTEELKLSENLHSSDREPSENLLVCEFNSITSLMPIQKKGSILPMPVGPSVEDVEKVFTHGEDMETVVKKSEPCNRESQEHGFFPVTDCATQCIQTLDNQRLSVKDVEGNQTSPVFLKCEDLEQSLLSESVGTQNHPRQGNTACDTDKKQNLLHLLEKGSSGMCNSSRAQDLCGQQHAEGTEYGIASSHLMSLLQKSAGGPSSEDDSTNATLIDASALSTRSRSPEEEQCSEVISLETLFGRKFVNELKSVGEPVSSKQVVDASIHASNPLDVVLASSSQTSGSAHADVSFHQAAEWKYDSQILRKQIHSGITPGSGLQDNHVMDFSMEMSPVRASNNAPALRGVIASRPVYFDFRQQKVSHIPHQSHERYHHQTSKMPSHNLFLDPIHDANIAHESSLQNANRFVPSAHLYPFHEERVQAGNHIPVYLRQHSFPVGDRRVGNRPGDAEAFLRINPYQHPMLDERTEYPGIGLSPRLQGFNAGLPSDRWGNSKSYYQ